MRELNTIEMTSVSGAIIHCDGVYIEVPSTGIPAWAFAQIEGAVQASINGDTQGLNESSYYMHMTGADAYIDQYSANSNNPKVLFIL